LAVLLGATVIAAAKEGDAASADAVADADATAVGTAGKA